MLVMTEASMSFENRSRPLQVRPPRANPENPSPKLGALHTRLTLSLFTRHETNLLRSSQAWRLSIPRHLQTHHPRRSRRHDFDRTNGAPPYNGEIHRQHPLLHHRQLHPQTLTSVAIQMYTLQVQPAKGSRHPAVGRQSHRERGRQDPRRSSGESRTTE